MGVECSACAKRRAQQKNVQLQPRNITELCRARRIALRQIKTNIDRIKLIEKDSDLKKEYIAISSNIQKKLINRFYCISDEEVKEMGELKTRIDNELTKFGLKK